MIRRTVFVLALIIAAAAGGYWIDVQIVRFFDQYP